MFGEKLVPTLAQEFSLLSQTLIYSVELAYFIMQGSGRAASVGDFLRSLLQQIFVGRQCACFVLFFISLGE